MKFDYPAIKKNFSFKCLLDISAKKFAAYKIGGPIDCLAYPENTEDLKTCLSFCSKEKIPVIILGRATNVLIGDKGIRGIVISTDNLDKIETSGDIADVQAGALWDNFIKLSAERGLGGLEKTSGIPGSVGGAVFMNAGAFGQEVFDKIISFKVMDSSGNVSDIKKDDVRYSYRRVEGLKNLVILSAKFSLERSDAKELLRLREDILKKRIEKQPLDFPSAGSVFKRPEKDYASRLIDVCGLKGFKVGGAEVSSKHAGFIINADNATAEDVRVLMEKIKEEVEKKTGIELELEQILMGEF